ncbi:MAG: nucleoside phosphorylase [Clostridia bacterium]|nr:nucleoside phosphorylase [Clostridia bacterium]
MIKIGKGEPFIKPTGIRFKQGQDPNIKLPKVAIGVFSHYLFYDVVEKFKCKEVGIIINANFERNVYILNYKGQLFTFFMAGVGAPAIAADIEELHAQGVEKVIIFGNCGVLDSSIKDCSIIIPNMAYRDEGTSYHYAEESDSIEVNQKYKDEFIELLKTFNFDYTIGATWTTDAFYRETTDKIQQYKNLDVKTVEMEGATIAAVCRCLGMDYFTFYYAGDNLDTVEWDERSLSGLVNIDKKKEVTILAFELAMKIISMDTELE